MNIGNISLHGIQPKTFWLVASPHMKIAVFVPLDKTDLIFTTEMKIGYFHNCIIIMVLLWSTHSLEFSEIIGENIPCLKKKLKFNTGRIQWKGQLMQLLFSHAAWKAGDLQYTEWVWQQVMNQD